MATEARAVVEAGTPDIPAMAASPATPGAPSSRIFWPSRPTRLGIWDLISNGKYTAKFYKLASKYKNVIQILNSTNTNITVFIPTDDNFYLTGGGDDGGKKSSSNSDDDNKNGPSSEFIEDTLLYHITWRRHLVSDLVHRQTLASACNESWLGGRPQRLRNRVGPFGEGRVNFFSKVMGANIVSLIKSRVILRPGLHEK